jgi:hypothetical protein
MSTTAKVVGAAGAAILGVAIYPLMNPANLGSGAGSGPSVVASTPDLHPDYLPGDGRIPTDDSHSAPKVVNTVITRVEIRYLPAPEHSHHYVARADAPEKRQIKGGKHRKPKQALLKGPGRHRATSPKLPSQPVDQTDTMGTEDVPSETTDSQIAARVNGVITNPSINTSVTMDQLVDAPS